jgi:hypothetical protein
MRHDSNATPGGSAFQHRSIDQEFPITSIDTPSQDEVQ